MIQRSENFIARTLPISFLATSFLPNSFLTSALVQIRCD